VTSQTASQPSRSPLDQQPERAITPRVGWMDIDLAGVWRYRDLVRLLVRRDFVAFYKQTLLGPLWYLLQPLANALVFTVIFGHVAKLPTDGMPPFLFYLASMVAWTYFASCVTHTSNTFSANASLFGKVYFPRLVVPIAVVIAQLMSFVIQFTMFVGFLLWYMATGLQTQPTAWILLTPLLVLQSAAAGLGVGLIVSALTIRYRDLGMAVGFGISLWMYLTPIVYPLSRVPEGLKILFVLNPMTGVVEMFRIAYLGAGSITIAQYAAGLLVTAAILFAGLMIFARFEKSFVDTI
jgi:lipopolysaccharide transport system permease protein